MREIEFLPPWYAQFLRRRRTVFFQTWVSVGVTLGLGLWIFLADRNHRSAEIGESYAALGLVELA